MLKLFLSSLESEGDLLEEFIPWSICHTKPVHRFDIGLGLAGKTMDRLDFALANHVMKRVHLRF